ncbi:rhodanese-like domain-containing protein [Neoroseomonas lacus]|uniref:Thiosulfate sulfurtransferase n=1 Tax=Neoroseomonas lacus TaxID=287609 RepID=A0A917NZD9_9PROT|nr:rhodanese-like domain-containing protein [Neoroseomonas lacus]GGJ43656.1 thiosulfate sulfurtransferase [Neoroseomonas lacus]
MPKQIDAATLKGWIADGRELAILDAREEGEFGRSHLFWAIPCPLSKKEFRARALLPRLATRVVCVDGGEGYAAQLAAYLEGIGCTDVGVLAGGTPGWITAGYTAFSGVNVPSKAFGEWIEHHYETPSVDPGELKAMMDAGTDMVVLDSRPIDEFRRMTIPTAVNVPGGELVYRIGEFVTRPETTIVVNCAGRTRSILGAESLRSAGVPNKVVALRNGTMGWELAGFTCDRGRSDRYPDRTPVGVETALDRADRFARKNGVRFITRAEFERMQGEPGRTTYLLDVRDPAEFNAGHLVGSRSAPGGQLVQATDQWVAVRGARIVLVDDTGVRARMTGGWLRQLGGWDVCVLTDGLQGRIEEGSWAPHCPEAEALRIPHVTPAELAVLAGEGAAQVVDLARSIDFRDGHVPGALWGIRTRLARLSDRLTGDRQIVVAAPEEAQARLAAAELQGFAKAPVKILAGGTKAWAAAGFPMAADRRDPEDADCVDFYLRPYDRNEGIEEAMHAYLSWEIDLVHEVKKDGDAPFGAWV